MSFWGGVRQRLGGGVYNFPGALFFPVLDMSNSILVPVESVGRMFTCPPDHSENPLPCLLFWGAGFPSENARSDSWNAGEQFTPWLKEGEGLFENNTFVQFLVTTRSHHSSQILPVKSSLRSLFLPSNGTDSLTAKKAHERSILIVGLAFGEGRYVVLNCNSSPCKHMVHSLHVSPGVSSVGRGVTLLQES
jgi:hypothetical protein